MSTEFAVELYDSAKKVWNRQPFSHATYDLAKQRADCEFVEPALKDGRVCSWRAIEMPGSEPELQLTDYSCY